MLKCRSTARFILILLFSASVSVVFLSFNVSAYDGYELLVIGPQAYEFYIERFIALKQRLGVRTRYVSVEWINESFQKVDLVWGIHEFVTGEYEGSGIKYLLLVGTYDQVPTKYIYSPSDEAGFADFNYKPSDWFYGVPDWQDSMVGLLGGNVPKITVGRLPVKNGEELEQIISKMSWVETNPPKGGFLIFQDDNLASKPLIDFSAASGSSIKNISADSFVRMLSTDVAHAVTYTHGTPSGLWISTENKSYTPLFTVSDVNFINKTYGIHYLVACFTGALDLEDESLARALISSYAGPILVIANSRTEALRNPLPSIFWDRFFRTGDVADSLIQAVTIYLNDPTVFDRQRPSFQKYNFYLCQVVYGDVSWKVKDLEKSVTAHEPSAAFPLKIESFNGGCRALSPLSNYISTYIVCVLVSRIYRMKIAKLKNGRKMRKV